MALGLLRSLLLGELRAQRGEPAHAPVWSSLKHPQSPHRAARGLLSGSVVQRVVDAQWRAGRQPQRRESLRLQERHRHRPARGLGGAEMEASAQPGLQEKPPLPLGPRGGQPAPPGRRLCPRAWSKLSGCSGCWWVPRVGGPGVGGPGVGAPGVGIPGIGLPPAAYPDSSSACLSMLQPHDSWSSLGVPAHSGVLPVSAGTGPPMGSSQYPSLWSVSNGAIAPGAQTPGMPNGLGAPFFRGSSGHTVPLAHPAPAASSASPLYEAAAPAADITDGQYDPAAQARLIAPWTPVSPSSM
ncbi:PREDICTED: brachyury protein [Condylura cristata]|uniref:brachyury protein n=1 Tax=Condylura cristata TaxID=143302 RepID=UPI000642983A|nr:PREDICTED: brachyury protein [Condylura cristata]